MNTDFLRSIVETLLITYLLSSPTKIQTADVQNRLQIIPRRSFFASHSISEPKSNPRTENAANHLIEPDNNTNFLFHGRGGKFLNLRLSPDDVQPRIMNHGDLNQIHSYRQQLPLEHDEEVSCICVPRYLCSSGQLTSKGLTSTHSNRISRSANENSRDLTKRLIVVRLYDIRSDKNNCKQNEECCQFPHQNAELISPNANRVATPLPDDFFTTPQNIDGFPSHSTRSPGEACGVRFAYGVHGRLVNMEYPPDVVEFGQYPWQVAILEKSGGDESRYLCGGVLISSHWIATVAHCLKDINSENLQVRIGEWDVDRRDEIYPHVDGVVISVIIHPEFSPENLHNDIALVRLADGTDSQYPHITPACLPESHKPFFGQQCWVSGWGKDFFGPQGKYQNALREVDVPVLSSDFCQGQLRRTKLGPYFKLHPGFLCAGGEAGKDACTGDGGSPLVCDRDGVWFVVGLVSWGIGCGEPNVPGVYTNIDYYLDWIKGSVFS